MSGDWLDRRKANGFDWQPTVEALAGLVVRSDAEWEVLVVDASALVRSDHEPCEWWLRPADEDGEWEHGPSGTSGPLLEMLVSIAETYTR